MRVIITGASQGIGYAIANLFAKEGHDLILTSKTASLLEASAIKLQQMYPAVDIEFKAFDLSNKTDCQTFATWALSVGSVDVLVNNAGYFLPGNITDESEGNIEAQLNANLLSAYYVTRGIIPSMIANQSGHIFNMGSIAGHNAYANGGSYSISKFALHGFSQNLRLELKDKGIKVTLIAPGAVYTNSWAGSGVDPKRIMEADDIAKMIYAATQLSPQAVVEDIILRPLLGDL
jgi:short-subunit dehydrogenase